MQTIATQEILLIVTKSSPLGSVISAKFSNEKRDISR